MSTDETTVLGWHFLPAEGWLAHGDGRAVRVGQTYRVEGTIVPCENGLHACVRAIDALGYAPGPIVCRVRLSGVIVGGADKHAASGRTVLAMADATRTLHEFALWCAEDAPEAAAEDAVWAAAWTAVEDAARAAAWAAAEGSVWGAAREAAWAAARAAQNVELERRLLSLLGEQP